MSIIEKKKTKEEKERYKVTICDAAKDEW